MFIGIIQVFRFSFQKVQNYRNVELLHMHLFGTEDVLKFRNTICLPKRHIQTMQT